MKLTRFLLSEVRARHLFLVVILAAGIARPITLIADDDDNENEQDTHLEHFEHQDRVSDRRQKNSVLRQLSPAPENSTYKTECSSCHMLYPPGLLPARSWNKIMKGLEDHFGENASLDGQDPKTEAEITSYLTTYAADKAPGSRRSARIASSIPQQEAPIRISETRVFKRWHHEIRSDIWKRKKVGGAFNCIACHSEAEKGYFDEHSVKIPRDEVPPSRPSPMPRKRLVPSPGGELHRRQLFSGILVRIL